MFLHLGSNVMVPGKDVIAILNIDASRHSAINREFLKSRMEDPSSMAALRRRKIKAFVVTREKVYLSSLSASTLARRAGWINALLAEDE